MPNRPGHRKVTVYLPDALWATLKSDAHDLTVQTGTRVTMQQLALESLCNGRKIAFDGFIQRQGEAASHNGDAAA